MIHVAEDPRAGSEHSSILPYFSVGRRLRGCRRGGVLSGLFGCERVPQLLDGRFNSRDRVAVLGILGGEGFHLGVESAALLFGGLGGHFFIRLDELGLSDLEFRASGAQGFQLGVLFVDLATKDKGLKHD